MQPSSTRIKPVSVFNEWSRIEEVILGIASPIYFPPPRTIISPCGSPWWLRLIDKAIGLFLVGRRIPAWINKGFQDEIAGLHRILQAQRIHILRPAPITPLCSEEPGLSQVFARDPIIAIGNTVIIGRQKLVTLRKEIRGFEPILQSLKEYGVAILQVPTVPEDIFLEGGDVLVDDPYVFVGVGNLASNTKGAEWLQGALGTRFKVVPVRINQPGIFHLDTCMTLIGPQLGIICRSALAQPLPAPLNEYEFIEVNETVRSQIGTNVLVLNPEIVILQARHDILKSALQRKCFRTILIPFRWHGLAGGAFRCVTHPLRRAHD